MPLGLRELFKSLIFLIKKYRDPELMQTIIELQAQIMDIMETKDNLSHAVNELQKQLSLKQSIHFKDPLFYTDGNSVPICPRCWQIDGKSVYLIAGKSISQDEWQCPQCRFDSPKTALNMTASPSPHLR